MIENKFKKSEIGLIPKDWKETPIGLVANIINGSTPPTADAENYGGEYLFVSPADLGEHKYIVDTIKKLSSKGFAISRRLPSGSILYTCTGSTIGKCGIASCELTSNQQINAILPNDSYNNEYLYYAIQTREQDIRSNASVQAVPLINKAAFSKTLVAFPEKDEQSRIATALSDVDELIATLKKLIEKKRNIKQGARQELLSGKRRLSGFKDKWVETTLGEICQITMGQSPESKYYNTKGDGLPLIQGNADMDNRKSIIRFYSSCYSKCCDAGDIIMSVRAPVGSIGRAQYKSCLGRGVCALKYDNDFLYYYLVSIENTWSASSKGSIFESINSKELSETVISIPHTKEEQIAIAEILSDMDSEISMLESRLTKYQSLKQGMMQQLLTGKIRLI